MKIMLNDMPDHPLTRERILLALPCAFENVLQVGRCPARKAFLNELQSLFQAADQFGSATHRLTSTIPFSHRGNVLTALTHQPMKPAHTYSYDVCEDFTNRTQVRRATQGKLFG